MDGYCMTGRCDGCNSYRALWKRDSKPMMGGTVETIWLCGDCIDDPRKYVTSIMSAEPVDPPMTGRQLLQAGLLFVAMIAAATMIALTFLSPLHR